MKRILVAEDRPASLELIRTVLESAGYEVIDAMDGQDALHKAGTNSVDLVLLDLQMPGMNGLEVLRALRDRNLLARIIMVTLHDSPEIRAECRQGGTDGFVAKSDLAHDLPKEIARIFNNNSGDHNSRG